MNTESGTQPQIALALRWQTDNNWLFHLQANRQSGATDYSGYLQYANGKFTPYTARTGNVSNQIHFALGYAFQHGDWQIAPLIQFGQHHWERNLAQYSEAYDYATTAAGALLQWQAHAGTVVEMQALAGQTRAASVKVPSLDFSATQPSGTLREWQIGIRQDLGSLTGMESLSGWSLTARYTAAQYGHEASPLVGDLQAPANEHRPSGWMLGLQKQF